MTEQYNLKLNKKTDSVEVVVSVVPQTNVEGYTRLCVLNSDKQRQLINNLFIENNINKNNYILSSGGQKLANDHAPYETKWIFNKKTVDKTPKTRVKSTKTSKNITPVEGE
jgi:hypothetical protein